MCDNGRFFIKKKTDKHSKFTFFFLFLILIWGERNSSLFFSPLILLSSLISLRVKENKAHCWDRKILAQMILLSLLCFRVKRNPLLGQKNSKSNNHIDMVWTVLLTGMDKKREKLIIGEKKESELYTPFPHVFCFSSVTVCLSTQPTPPSLPLPLPLSHSLALSHWKSLTLHGVFFSLSLAHNARTWPR